MLLTVRSTATYELPAETFLALMIEPNLEGPAHRVIQERLMTSPTLFSDLNRDLYGNPRRHLVAPPGTFTFEFTATIEPTPNRAVPREAIQHPPRDLSSEAMVYTLPSRYCQSDLLARMARGEFGHAPTGGERVLAVAEWVRRHVEYRYGTTDSLTSAFDTATERVGVCRDFAHLVIAFCRASTSPRGTSPAMPWAWSRPISMDMPRFTSAGPGTTLTRPSTASGPPWSPSPSAGSSASHGRASAGRYARNSGRFAPSGHQSR